MTNPRALALALAMAASIALAAAGLSRRDSGLIMAAVFNLAVYFLASRKEAFPVSLVPLVAFGMALYICFATRRWGARPLFRLSEAGQEAAYWIGAVVASLSLALSLGEDSSAFRLAPIRAIEGITAAAFWALVTLNSKAR